MLTATMRKILSFSAGTVALLLAVRVQAQPLVAPTPEVILKAIEDGYSKNEQRYLYDVFQSHCSGPCVYTPYFRVAAVAQEAKREMRPKPTAGEFPPEMFGPMVQVVALPMTTQRCSPTGLLITTAKGSREQKAAQGKRLTFQTEERRYSNAFGAEWVSARLVAEIPLEDIKPGLAVIATYDNCDPQQTSFPTKKAPW